MILFFSNNLPWEMRMRNYSLFLFLKIDTGCNNNVLFIVTVYLPNCSIITVHLFSKRYKVVYRSGLTQIKTQQQNELY